MFSKGMKYKSATPMKFNRKIKAGLKKIINKQRSIFNIQENATGRLY
jgi:hypothetical protein